MHISIKCKHASIKERLKNQREIDYNLGSINQSLMNLFISILSDILKKWMCEIGRHIEEPKCYVFKIITIIKQLCLAEHIYSAIRWEGNITMYPIHLYAKSI